MKKSPYIASRPPLNNSAAFDFGIKESSTVYIDSSAGIPDQ